MGPEENKIIGPIDGVNAMDFDKAMVANYHFFLDASSSGQTFY